MEVMGEQHWCSSRFYNLFTGFLSPEIHMMIIAPLSAYCFFNTQHVFYLSEVGLLLDCHQDRLPLLGGWKRVLDSCGFKPSSKSKQIANSYA